MEIQSKLNFKTLNMQTTLVLVILAILESFTAQTVNIDCDFVVSGSDYICQLSAVQVVDNENQQVIIGGKHVKGKSDEDVSLVMLFASETPFVLTQIFTTFLKLENLILHDCGLTRIQLGSTVNGASLQQLAITANPQLKAIPANAFQGTSKLTQLILGGNQIESISLAAFNGLTSLRFLFISQNQIQSLPLNTFRPLTSLQHLVLSHNFIESIDGRLFVNNNQLDFLDISANRISGIQENVFDQLTNLRSFDARGNKCVNRRWNINEDNREDLRECFESFVKLPVRGEGRMEVRGKMIIRDESGNEIVRFGNKIEK